MQIGSCVVYVSVFLSFPLSGAVFVRVCVSFIKRKWLWSSSCMQEERQGRVQTQPLMVQQGVERERERGEEGWEGGRDGVIRQHGSVSCSL